MLVKARDRQLSFWFQEQDPFFEIGYRILEQEQIPQMLPYQRKQCKGREKLVYQALGENLDPLREAVPGLGEDKLIGLLCNMISLNIRIEENGFLKKECIWYQYDHLYYDKAAGQVMAAVLPITGALRYADSNWFACFEETIIRIAAYLPYSQMVYVRKIIQMLKMDKITQEEALVDLQGLGGRGAERLSSAHASQNTILKLLYHGNDKELEFLIDDEDFLIGRNVDAADGVIPMNFSRAVSRKHCLITKMNDKYFVQDLKSVNHTLVNGIMIPPYELMELENNDILSVADIEFRVKTSQS